MKGAARCARTRPPSGRPRGPSAAPRRPAPAGRRGVQPEQLRPSHRRPQRQIRRRGQQDVLHPVTPLPRLHRRRWRSSPPRSADAPRHIRSPPGSRRQRCGLGPIPWHWDGSGAVKRNARAGLGGRDWESGTAAIEPSYDRSRARASAACRRGDHEDCRDSFALRRRLAVQICGARLDR